MSARLDEARRAYEWADTSEWLHGRNCRSIDCQTCIDLMTTTNEAHARLEAIRAERTVAAA